MMIDTHYEESFVPWGTHSQGAQTAEVRIGCYMYVLLSRSLLLSSRGGVSHCCRCFIVEARRNDALLVITDCINGVARRVVPDVSVGDSQRPPSSKKVSPDAVSLSNQPHAVDTYS